MTKWISSSFCRQLMQLIIKWMNWETPKGFEREREHSVYFSFTWQWKRRENRAMKGKVSWNDDKWKQETFISETEC